MPTYGVLLATFTFCMNRLKHTLKLLAITVLITHHSASRRMWLPRKHCLSAAFYRRRAEHGQRGSYCLVCRSNGKWSIGMDDMMTPSSHGRTQWTVTDFNNFMRARGHVDIGPVLEPSLLRNPIVLATLLLMLAPAVYGAWKIYTSSWIGNPWIWTTLVLLVFMFATSGVLLASFACHVSSRSDEAVWRVSKRATGSGGGQGPAVCTEKQ